MHFFLFNAILIPFSWPQSPCTGKRKAAGRHAQYLLAPLFMRRHVSGMGDKRQDWVRQSWLAGSTETDNCTQACDIPTYLYTYLTWPTMEQGSVSEQSHLPVQSNCRSKRWGVLTGLIRLLFPIIYKSKKWIQKWMPVIYVHLLTLP